MLVARDVLCELSARLPLDGKRLLVIGQTSKSMELAACAREFHAMHVENLAWKQDDQAIPCQALNTFDAILVADANFKLGDRFLNLLQPSAWLVLDRICMQNVDLSAIKFALWFETIGGVVWPDMGCRDSLMWPSERAIEISTL